MSLTLKGFVGLVTAPDQLNVVNGALATATNCALLRPGLITPTPQLTEHSTISASSANVHALWEAGSTRYAFFDDGASGFAIFQSTIGSTTWTQIAAATFDFPDGADFKFTHGVVGNRHFIAESEGIREMSGSSIPAFIGFEPPMPDRANSSTAVVVGGPLETQAQKAYRATLVFRDSGNTREVESPPSGRLVFRNDSATDAKTTTSRWLLPRANGTTATDLDPDLFRLRVYASQNSAGEDISPDDELGLVYEKQLITADITAGYVDVTDFTPDALRGSALYTNETQQGILQANNPPPFAKIIGAYKGCLLAANILTRQRLALNILAVGGTNGIQDTDTLTVDDGTTTFTVTAATTPAAADEYQIENTGTPSQDNSLTAQNIVAAINRHTSNTFVYARYIGVPSDPRTLGLIEIYMREANSGANFTVYVGSGDKTDCFEPALGTSSGATARSIPDSWPNGWALSDYAIPDSWPIAQTGRMGAGNIIGYGALDDAAFFFHDSGEVWMMSGDPPVDGVGGSLRVEHWRSNLELLSPQSIKVLDQRLLCLTNQGVVAITPAGYEVLSAPIQPTIRSFLGDLTYDELRQEVAAVVHPVERRYELFRSSNETDREWQQFIYWAEAGAWTRGNRKIQAAYWSLEDQKPYYARETLAQTEAADSGNAATITTAPIIDSSGKVKQLREVQVVYEGGQAALGSLSVTSELDNEAVAFNATQGTDTLRVPVGRVAQRGLRHTVTISLSAVDAGAAWRLSEIRLLYRTYGDRVNK